jgi:hypothetical protein
MAELPGEAPITLSDIAQRIEDFKDVMLVQFKELNQKVESYQAEVEGLKAKLRNCPSLHPNGSQEVCDT